MSTENAKDRLCFDREAILSVLEGRNTSADLAGDVLLHLSKCEECRQGVSFVCSAIADEKRRKLTRRFKHRWKSILWDVSLRAGRADDNSDALAAAAPERVLVFVSFPNDICSWRAEISFPDGDYVDCGIHVCVKDKSGKPLAGTFVFCGVECNVKEDGTSMIPLVKFRANHLVGGVSFAESGKTFVEGVPVIGLF